MRKYRLPIFIAVLLLAFVAGLYTLANSLGSTPKKACNKMIGSISAGDAGGSYKQLTQAGQTNTSSDDWELVVASLKPYYNGTKAVFIKSEPTTTVAGTSSSTSVIYHIGKSEATCYVVREGRNYIVDSFRNKPISD